MRGAAQRPRPTRPCTSAEPQRDKRRAPRRRRAPGAAFRRDPHRRRLPDAERHHEGDAGVVDRDLVRRQRIGAEQPDQHRRDHEDPDLQRLQSADRHAERRMRRISAQVSAMPPRSRCAGRRAATAATPPRQPEKHQPLDDRRGIAGARQPQRAAARDDRRSAPSSAPTLAGTHSTSTTSRRAPAPARRAGCARPQSRESRARPRRRRAETGRSRAVSAGS